jgi:outer membrane lipoprotein SlyB
MQATSASPSPSSNVPQWMWVIGAIVALTATGVASALAWQSASRPAAPVVAAVQAPPVAPPAAPVAPPVAPRVAQAPVERAAPPVAVCRNCGVVESVQAVKVKGDGSGVGAVAGGVLGGVVGNQFGSGNGRAAMTVLGAVGGGFAGNEAEKHVKAKTVYSVRVRMDDGSLRTLQQSQAPATGARVQVEGSTLRGV